MSQNFIALAITVTTLFATNACAAVEIISITREYGFIHIDTHASNKGLADDITCTVRVNKKMVAGGQVLSMGAFNRVSIQENSGTRGKKISIECS